MSFLAAGAVAFVVCCWFCSAFLLDELINVDPGLINPSHYWGGVPSKSDESLLKGDTSLLIHQRFINPGLTLLCVRVRFVCHGRKRVASQTDQVLGVSPWQLQLQRVRSLASWLPRRLRSGSIFPKGDVSTRGPYCGWTKSISHHL